MSALRRMERFLYPCEETDSSDFSLYPPATDFEFADMESESVDRSVIHIFPYIRHHESMGFDYVEIYVYDIMLYPLACFRRFVIRDRYRMTAEAEADFEVYIRQCDVNSICAKRFEEFMTKAVRIFPQWHLQSYGVYAFKHAFSHILYASGPCTREIIYKAGLYNLAYRMDRPGTPELNLMGTDPETIFDMPLNMLHMINSPALVDHLMDQNNFDRVREVYRAYSGYIQGVVPSGAQYRYLERLYENNGLFAGHRFNRALFNKLRREFNGYILKYYEKFLRLNDQLPLNFRLRLPGPEEICSVLRSLETAWCYQEVFPERESKIKEIKQKTLYEYSDDRFPYIVIMPGSSYDFAREEITRYHCLCQKDYLDRHASGSSVFLFVRMKESPDTPFVTVEVCDNEITQVFSDRYNPAPKDVYLFLGHYSVVKSIKYDPYQLISQSLDEDGVRVSRDLWDYYHELGREKDRKEYL